MGILFRHLGLWLDDEPRDGPAQMACDEALLEHCEEPVLRRFRWAAPWASAGYFTPWTDARAVRSDLPLCRRWTGGGIVIHEGDFTFSLAAPRTEKWSTLRPSESYAALHAALAAALAAAGMPAELSSPATRAARECFASPVQHDIVSGARKIAGGAQRRTKRGLLHQGSVQATGLPDDFAILLAQHLAGRTGTWAPPEDLAGRIRVLTETKYAQPAFLQRC